MCKCACMRVCVCVRMYVCEYMCLCVYACIHTRSVQDKFIRSARER